VSENEVAQEPRAPERTDSIRPGTQEDLAATAGERVFFELDSHSLSDEARLTLARQAAWLVRYGNVSILIAGNADERGTREYNLALGSRRAAAVREVLIQQGVAPSRIRTVSYGKERPIALGSNEEAWARNRNAHTVLVNASGRGW
jgi:peptidoglycan-associated lipoprotein